MKNIWTFKLKDLEWHNLFQITLTSAFNSLYKCTGSVAQGYLCNQHKYRNTQGIDIQVQLHNKQEQDRKGEVSVSAN
jgi:hypothetical protein